MRFSEPRSQTNVFTCSPDEFDEKVRAAPVSVCMPLNRADEFRKSL